MRVVTQVELVLRGGRYAFEDDLGPAELIDDTKRSYLIDSTSVVLEELRSGHFFSGDPSAYIALAYQTTRGNEPRAVIDHDGNPIKPYRKGTATGPDTTLRWVHKSMYIVEEGGGWENISGWQLNLAIPTVIQKVLLLESNAVGSQFVNKLMGGFE